MKLNNPHALIVFRLYQGVGESVRDEGLADTRGTMEDGVSLRLQDIQDLFERLPIQEDPFESGSTE